MYGQSTSWINSTQILTCTENGLAAGGRDNVLDARGIRNEADAGVVVVVQEGECRVLQGDKSFLVVDHVHAVRAVQHEDQVNAT